MRLNTVDHYFWLKILVEDMSNLAQLDQMGGEYVIFQTKEDWLLAGGVWHIADEKAWSLKIAVIKTL